MSDDHLFHPDFKERPYWWEAAPPPEPTLPPLPERTDVLVVGGGYCGLNAALELRRHGVEVTVIEAERFGFGASSRNGGMVSGGLKLATSGLADVFGAERAKGLIEEAVGSLGFLEELIQREGIDCHYKRVGRFLGAHCPKAYREIESGVENFQRITGTPAEMLPRARQREEIGTDLYHGGMRTDATGGLHPALYHQGLAGAVRRAGAHLVDGTRVENIARAEGGFAVRTARGTVGAREVMVATNGYTTAATPWLRRRLIPLASYIIATEPIEPALMDKLVPNRRMISDSKRVLHYYRPSPDGTRILFGGRASFRQLSARTAAPRLHEFMCEVWPELRNTRITHAWNGNVAFTFDLVPHIATHEGVHYAAGCQGSGVAMASWLGNQVGLKIAGKANRPSAFDGLPFPTRPFYTGRPWFLPIVGNWYRFMDWMERRRTA